MALRIKYLTEQELESIGLDQDPSSNDLIDNLEDIPQHWANQQKILLDLLSKDIGQIYTDAGADQPNFPWYSNDEEDALELAPALTIPTKISLTCNPIAYTRVRSSGNLFTRPGRIGATRIQETTNPGAALYQLYDSINRISGVRENFKEKIIKSTLKKALLNAISNKIKADKTLAKDARDQIVTILKSLINSKELADLDLLQEDNTALINYVINKWPSSSSSPEQIDLEEPPNVTDKDHLLVLVERAIDSATKNIPVSPVVDTFITFIKEINNPKEPPYHNRSKEEEEVIKLAQAFQRTSATIADETDRMLKGFVEDSVKNNQHLEKEQKKKIIALVQAARTTNFALDRKFTQDGLVTAIKANISTLTTIINLHIYYDPRASEIEALKNKILEKLDELSSLLSDSATLTTRQSLRLHKKATRLRNSLLKLTKIDGVTFSDEKTPDGEATLDGKATLKDAYHHLADQLPALIKDRVDYRYENSGASTWEKFINPYKRSPGFKLIALGIAIVSATVCLATLVAGFLLPPAAPVLWLISSIAGLVTFSGLAPIFVDKANIARNLLYGRMPVRESNVLTTIATVAPLIITPFFKVIMPALKSLQATLIANHAPVGEEIVVGLAENTMTIGVGGVFNTFLARMLSMFTWRNSAKVDAEVNNFELLDANEVGPQIHKDQDQTTNTARYIYTQLTFPLSDKFKKSSKKTKNTADGATTEVPTGKRRYTNFYMLERSDGEPTPVPSRHAKIAGTSGFFANNVTQALKDYRALKANATWKQRIDALRNIETQTSYYTKDKETAETMANKQYTPKLYKLNQRVQKEIDLLNNGLDDASFKKEKIKTGVIEDEDEISNSLVWGQLPSFQGYQPPYVIRNLEQEPIGVKEEIRLFILPK